MQQAQARSDARTALRSKPALNRGTGSKSKGSKSNTTSKPKPSASAAAATKTKTGTAPTTDQPQITPYLASQDLMNLGDDVAAAENATTNSKFALETAKADSVGRTQQNVEDWRAGVANANDDAAARGLYNSGIRASNVSKANTSAVRSELANKAALSMAAIQAGVQQNAAKQQLARKLQGYVALSAERGAALPVAPQSQNGATNVPGAATVAKVKMRSKKAKR